MLSPNVINPPAHEHTLTLSPEEGDTKFHPPLSSTLGDVNFSSGFITVSPGYSVN